MIAPTARRDRADAADDDHHETWIRISSPMPGCTA